MSQAFAWILGILFACGGAGCRSSWRRKLHKDRGVPASDGMRQEEPMGSWASRLQPPNMFGALRRRTEPIRKPDGMPTIRRKDNMGWSARLRRRTPQRGVPTRFSLHPTPPAPRCFPIRGSFAKAFLNLDEFPIDLHRAAGFRRFSCFSNSVVSSGLLLFQLADSYSVCGRLCCCALRTRDRALALLGFSRRFCSFLRDVGRTRFPTDVLVLLIQIGTE